MAKVRIGSVYALPEFHGKAEGKGRFLPSRAWTWGRITLLNMPTANVLAVADIDGLLGVQCAGAFWLLAGISANCPVPGYLIETDPLGAARAMSDDRIARKLDIEPRTWVELSAAMLDVGALARTDAALDIPDELAAAPSPDRQNVFPFCDQRHWDSNGAHNELNQNESDQNETKRNKPDPRPRTAPEAAATRDAPVRVVEGGGLEKLRATIIQAIRTGPIFGAMLPMDEFCRLSLGPDWANATQGNCRRAFGLVWRSTNFIDVRESRINAWLDVVEDAPNLLHVENKGAWLKGAAKNIAAMNE